MRVWRSKNGERINAEARAKRPFESPEVRARDDANRLRRRMLARDIIDSAKVGGCVDCGTKEQSILQFDHVRGEKVACVTEMLDAAPRRILAEIDKCEVRCANCHLRATVRRRASAAA